MRRFLSWIVTSSPVLIRDAAALLGAGLAVYGVWLIYEPAGFVLAGVLLLVASIISARGA